ncbi:replication A protein [Yersinia enterocolitica]
MPQIYRELVSNGITPERWELETLACGASVMFGGTKFLYPANDDWSGFPD